ncbi:MAG TPA: trypsin-like peptidase domain-containing protein [Gemmatimonadota bacterium]|nr:trypsin-like peptidase domain-containing protein [Gemmatimonadota bacterium]
MQFASKIVPLSLIGGLACASAGSQSLTTEPAILSPAGARVVRPVAVREPVTISAGDLNPSPAATLFDRLADAVFSIHGSRSRGSGFLITRDGLAITNFHVIDRQPDLVARLRDGRSLPVRILRYDRASDVALVRLPCAPECHTLPLGDEASFSVGSDVYIVGTPLTDFLSHTLTKGIVSGIRSRNGVTLLQTDAAINRGNSGGPIVNAADGTAIAIVSSKLVRDDVEGIGFGITIFDALEVLGVVAWTTTSGE